MNQYFPSNQCITEQNCVWIKDSFNMQNRLIEFNIISVWKKIIDVASDFVFQLIFKKTTSYQVLAYCQIKISTITYKGH